MKKVLLAALLLTAGAVTVLPVQASMSPRKVVAAPVPKNVADAFRALESQYAAGGMVCTNVQWTHVKNQYTATYTIASLYSDFTQDATATFLANGQRVAAVTQPE